MNPIRGEETLVLSDGREFKLVLDFEGMVAAEAAYRQPMAVLVTDWVGGFIGAMRCMLFGALRTNHSDLTLADAGAIIQSDAKAVNAALVAVDKKAYPDPAEDKESGKAEPAPRPRGKNSGRNGAKRA